MTQTIYNLKKPHSQPSFRSSAKSGKHTDPVLAGGGSTTARGKLRLCPASVPGCL